MSRLYLFVCVSLLSSAASANVLWRGDFSTGDTSQWTGAEEVSPNRLEVMKDPLGSGVDVLQATVVQGDNPINASGNRNELYWEGDDLNVGNGQVERFYHWRTMWPSDYVSPDTWQLFTQWHQYDGGGSPPVELYVNGENVMLTVQSACGGNNCNTPVWETSLQRGVWHDFVLDVNWSEDSSVGYYQLWYDGKLALGKTRGATLLSGGGGAYLKQGLYRNADIAETQIIFHTGMTVGTTLDDVMPSDSTASPESTTTTLATSAGKTITASTASNDPPAPSTTTSSLTKLDAKHSSCANAGGATTLGLLIGLFGLAFRRRVRVS